MSTKQETFQIPLEVAEAYEARFVPALFGQWAPMLVEFAGVEPDQSVLDVACGTGIVARTVADRRSDDSGIVGVDLNESMLTVARRVRPGIEWQQGDVSELPFQSGSFDVVLCQMALMFFPDRERAIAEMCRVAKPGGVVAIDVPGALDAQPVWGPFVEVAVRHAGAGARSLLNTYFSCGDIDELTHLFASSGLEDVRTHTTFGTAHFPSVDALVATEVESTPLIDRIADEVYEQIRADTRAALDAYTTPDGKLEAPIEGHLVAGRKP
jgi:ubiquinone/menaquinone biosynthesis C-methylase UbiE